MKNVFAALVLGASALWGQVVVNPTSIPDARTFQPYNQIFTATGGTPPYTFSINSGALPSGLTLSSNGELSGTSFVTGSFTFEVRAQDSTAVSAVSGSRFYTIRVFRLICPDPSARVGNSYSSSAFALPTGASVSFVTGAFPPGLSFTSGSGGLTGVPTTLGTFNFTLQSTYSNPPGTFTDQCSITVNGAFESMEPRTVARVGVPYRSAISTFEGASPLSYTLQSGSLPPGITLNNTNGLLTGTPTTVGNYSASILVTDSLNRSILAPAPINVINRAESPLEMRCPLPVGRGGSFYSSALSISAAVNSFSISDGSLPSGLTLNPTTGAITGIGGTASSGFFTATANLTGGGTVSRNCNISFSEGSSVSPRLFCPDQRDLVLGEPYSSRLVASGNQRPFSFFLYQTVLPAGLTLNADGTITGTPLTIGSTLTDFRVVDIQESSSASGLCNFIVSPPPPLSILTTSLPNGQVGLPYSFQLQTNGGVAPITFFESSGNDSSFAAAQASSPLLRDALPTNTDLPRTNGSSQLPPGLTLSSSGLISGTPTLAGTYTFSIVALDRVFQSDFRTYSITIFVPDPLRFNSRLLGSGTVGTPYSQSFDIAGGAPPYSLQISSGTLAPGIRLSNNGLSGTPTVAGAWPFTLQVTDSAGSVLTGDFTLNVAQGSFRLGCPAFEAELGAPYSSTPVVLGGRAPYQFSISGGALPPGLTLNPSTGEVSGRATSAGSYPFTLSVTDATPLSTAARCGIGVVGGPVRILTSGPITTVAGRAYAGSVEAVGGQPPYAISVVGPSAPGLSVAANGALSGTAAQVGDFNVVFAVRDATGATAQRAIVFRNTASDLRFACPVPAEINAGTPSTARIQISGGVAPFNVTLASGALPAGLSLGAPAANNSVPLTGTPTATGDFTLNLRASDATGTSVSQSCPLKVTGALLTLVTDQLPGARVGVDYAANLVANGGVTPLLFGVSAGSLPPGVGIDPASGALSGKPTRAGTYAATYSVRDRIGQTASRSLSILVEEGTLSLSIVTPAPLSDALVGRPYSQSFAAEGGTPPYTFSFSGELPPGLTFNNGITGTPTATGSGTATVTVRDNAGATAERSYGVRVVVDPALNIITDSLPDGVLNEPYTANVAAAGGTAPYTWTLINGSLPAGVNFDATLGRLVGTATTNGQFQALILVQDANGDVSRRGYNFEVRPAGVEKLEVTTASLAAASIGLPYSGALAARGGVEPYRWEIRGLLPQGLNLNGATISGTGSRVETARFLVVVTDSLGLVATRELSLSVAATVAPTITINGVPDTLGANASAPISISVTRPLAVGSTLRFTLRFTPDTIHNTDDPSVRFANGARTYEYFLPGNVNVLPAFPADLAIRTGTLAGVITLSTEFLISGATLPGPSQTITIRRAVPVISAVRLTRTSGAVEVRIEGFTNTRQLAEARLTFTFASGVDVTTSSTVTVNVAAAIQAWFANAASIPFGGQFGLTLPFNVTGDPANVTGVSAVVTNGEGASTSVSSQ